MRARREVILSAGTFGTPQILQLSGIGDPEHLSGIGIETRVALSGVGQPNEYDRNDPNLVRVQNRNATLAIIPAASTALAAWLIGAALLAGLVRLERLRPASCRL